MVNLKALAGSHPGCAAASPSSPQEMSCYWMTVSSTSPQCPHPSPPPSATLLIKKLASLCDPFGSHVPSLGRVQGKWTLHSDVAFEYNYSILSALWFGVTPLPAAPEPQDPQASSAFIAAPCHQFPVAPDPLVLPLSARSFLLWLSWTWQSGPCSLLWPVILTLWKTLLSKIILSSGACSWNTVEHSLELLKIWKGCCTETMLLDASCYVLCIVNKHHHSSKKKKIVKLVRKGRNAGKTMQRQTRLFELLWPHSYL